MVNRHSIKIVIFGVYPIFKQTHMRCLYLSEKWGLVQVADVCAKGVLQAAGWASRSCAGGNLSGGLSIHVRGTKGAKGVVIFYIHKLFKSKLWGESFSDYEERPKYSMKKTMVDCKK